MKYEVRLMPLDYEVQNIACETIKFLAAEFDRTFFSRSECFFKRH